MKHGPEVQNPVGRKLLEIEPGKSFLVTQGNLRQLSQSAWRWAKNHGFKVRTYQFSGGLIIYKLSQ